MTAKIKFNVAKPSDPVENVEVVEDKLSPLPSPTEEPVSIGEGVPSVEEVLQAEPKRKRGRPSKDKVVPLDIPPPTEDSEGTAELAPKKRGRKPGNTNKKSTILSAEKIGRQIFGLHMMLDVAFPGTAISQEKASMLGESIREVMDAYDITIDEKVTSLIGLAATVAIVEVPVALKVRSILLERSKSAKVKARPLEQVRQQKVESGEPIREQSNVVNFNEPYIERGKPM